MGRLMSTNLSENLKNRCLLRFLASHMTHLSYLLFRLLVPPSSKPQEVARYLCSAGFSRDETLRVCLSAARDILDELCHIYDPPINPMAPEMVIAQAIRKAMDEYNRTKSAAMKI